MPLDERSSGASTAKRYDPRPGSLPNHRFTKERAVRPTRPKIDRELDACGIGFVADGRGRASRDIVTAGLHGLACVKHRGAVAADAKTADGAGVLLPIPRRIFGESTGVATLFVRGDDPRSAIEAALADEKLTLLEWREVPTDPGELGDMARASMPAMVHAVFEPVGDAHPEERAALRLRRRIETTAPGVYVASCSFRTIVYKGLAPADALAAFYPDLADDRFEASFTIFHQRFSTNTLPTWERAQPFRMLCHNGEINAIAGNEARMAARARLGTEEVGLGPEDLFRPVFDPRDSDSGKLDAAVELMTRGGRDVRHVLAMLMPEAWEHHRDMDPDLRGFYKFHSALVEPWDGPAGVVFTDGIGVGARLDRNGLRPLRYAVCEDGFVMCASEVGAVDLSGHGTVQRGRLGPGQMLFVDPTRGFLGPKSCRERLAAAAPYSKWAADGFYKVDQGDAVLQTPPDLVQRQAAHGYTKEELAMVLKPMAEDAYEPTFAMGEDTPLPHMAARARPVHHYLKQRFAQVTNPPIDPIRERMVMSLRTLLGPRQAILTEDPGAARMLSLPSFFLLPDAVDGLQLSSQAPYPVTALDATFPVSDGPGGLRAAVDRLCREAVDAVREGAGIIVLDDVEVGPDRAPVPSLIATGAVHHHLVSERLRSLTSIITVSDSARDVHEIACLLGYGADAICPRLALQTVGAEADESDDDDVVSPEAQARFQAAVEAGVLKILSKMGISTIDSYRGAQIFEVLGLGDEVVDVCFKGTPSAVGGLGWEHVGDDVLRRHRNAYPEAQLESPGWVRVRKGGEYHAHSKEVVQALNDLTLVPEPPDGQTADMVAAHLLQRAIAGDDFERYETFRDLVDSRPPVELHDLLEPLPAGPAIPLDEVEPASEIVRRFSTGAMSHGALSKEAHETLAQAMNLIGGMSNCGEGGEDPQRYRTRGQGRDDKNSKIKQIASGRFGVTPEYLAFADELQIKMAQGSKPGEGGQLPGHKVSPEIARLRHTQPGVGLISPPPHHDIYSIEDLAQLIYDLKQVNAALVSVKLVAEDNVGTIAAGVVKALADVVHLSGHNGGTGASPLSSIKHAGLPWELGLADTQLALVENELRSRARIRVDGGFKTGRQVLVAALMGADEYSFGTSAMIAEGCIMLRACHRDTCKPGVATQRPHLRANFTGTPEGVATYFLFVAEEVRRLLASLGMRTLDEAVGRVELLRQRTTGDDRIDSVDLSSLIQAPADETAPRRFVERVEIQDPRSDLGDRLLADAFRAIWDGDEIDLDYRISNADRSVGAALSGAIALEYGELPPRGTARVKLAGTAGQSFGAFLTHGVEMDLHGEANDYVGKGMGGGIIVIRPPENDASDTPVLAGNTCLYGATGGELFVAGSVGERFAVRNSGATAVVEGAGDHCCEYMTGGTIVVLGRIGYNVGAGMTGGQAFVWTPHLERLIVRVNTDLIEAVRPDTDGMDEVRWLVERHAELSGSLRALELLKVWDQAVDQLWHLVPKDRVSRIGDTHAGRVVNV
jgi:glutamate synthase domain-containing protein 2/glutamate synthase domain-containing protein 1/glutamate synthase domain-containing protein 3